MPAQSIKPSSKTTLTNRIPLVDQGYTFNEVGFTFDEPGIFFGGNSDPFNQVTSPTTQMAVSIKPINSKSTHL